MTLVRTGSINLSTDGQIFPREIFSLKSVSLSLNALFDSSQVWLHFAKSKANPPVLPGCFRAINLLLPSLQVWDRSTRLLPEQETCKLCLSKAGACSHNWFVLDQSMWWVCPGASDPRSSWYSQLWNELSGNWKIIKSWGLKVYTTRMTVLLKPPVWEPGSHHVANLGGGLRWSLRDCNIYATKPGPKSPYGFLYFAF